MLENIIQFFLESLSNPPLIYVRAMLDPFSLSKICVLICVYSLQIKFLALEGNPTQFGVKNMPKRVQIESRSLQEHPGAVRCACNALATVLTAPQRCKMP